MQCHSAVQSGLIFGNDLDIGGEGWASVIRTGRNGLRNYAPSS